MVEQQFKHLFTPLKIGKITLKNRIHQVAANPRFYNGVEAPNERAINYYEARAKGGVGLIITNPHYPYSRSTAQPPTAYMSDDIIPVWSKNVDVIHKYGVKAFAQAHFSSNTNRGRLTGGGACMAASAVVYTDRALCWSQEVAHELQKDEILRIVEAYRGWARRAKEAGYDGLELAVIIGAPQETFLSPATNLRTDEYGGSFENRVRFLLETVDAMRDGAGSDLVLGVKFTADQLLDQVWWSKESGYTLDDAKEIAKRLEATGKIDYLHPCAPGGPAHIAPMYYPLGAFVYMAAAIKEVVSIPVFCDGRINDPVQAERILADNQADMIGMYRALCADPEFVNKAREGRVEEIRKCVACNEGCWGPMAPSSLPLSCAVNPEAGKEKVVSVVPADVKKRVMVIGGGGAGLEAARVAALRGHEVSLYEKEDILARDLTLAAKCPGREGWEDAIRYWSYQMKLLNVDLHLGTAVTVETVREVNPDAVVVATGAKAFTPAWPGADSKNVVEGKQVLAEEVEVGQNVVLMTYEHHLAGLSIAAFLKDKGKKVEVLVEPPYAADMVDPYSWLTAYTQMAEKGIAVTPLTSIKEVEGNAVVFYNVQSGAERVIEGVDTVVYVMDGLPNDALYHSLNGRVKEVYLVGQALSPRRLLDSVHDAYRAARTL